MPDAPLMLSISGLRGLIGSSLTPPVAARYAAAFGTWLRESTGQAHPIVVIGRDSRPSGPMIEAAALAGLNAVGCKAVSIGIATTPTTGVMVEHLGASGGMVITASHNPIIWNGIKALRHDGVAPPPDQAAEIIARFHDDRVDYAAVEDLQPIEQDSTADREHIDRILAHIDIGAIREAKLKVVLDSVHGAGGPVTAELMHELGVELVHLYPEATGLFPHVPEPTRENLVGLSGEVRKHRAHIGLAQDPDADRLAIVDETGAYIGEEYSLALCAAHVLGKEKGPVAANLSTSRMVDDIAAQHGVEVVRTQVGEANVAAGMRAAGAVIGGEGNGGVIWPKVVHVRDSLGTAALLLEMLAQTGRSVSELAAAIPAYSIVKDKIPVVPGLLDKAMEPVQVEFADATIDLQDGFRADYDDRWVNLRASNTEPIVRIIAEASDEAGARELIDRVKRVIDAVSS